MVIFTVLVFMTCRPSHMTTLTIHILFKKAWAYSKIKKNKIKPIHESHTYLRSGYYCPQRPCGMSLTGIV